MFFLSYQQYLRFCLSAEPVHRFAYLNFQYVGLSQLLIQEAALDRLVGVVIEVLLSLNVIRIVQARKNKDCVLQFMIWTNQFITFVVSVSPWIENSRGRYRFLSYYSSILGFSYQQSKLTGLHTHISYVTKDCDHTVPTVLFPNFL